MHFFKNRNTLDGVCRIEQREVKIGCQGQLGCYYSGSGEMDWAWTIWLMVEMKR